MEKYLNEVENNEVEIDETNTFSENDINDIEEDKISEDNLTGMLETLDEFTEEGLVDPEEESYE